MLRTMIGSIGLHLGAGFLVVTGGPSVPFASIAPDVFDIEIDIVETTDDAPIFDLAALGPLDALPDVTDIAQGETAPAAEAPQIEPLDPQAALQPETNQTPAPELAQEPAPAQEPEPAPQVESAADMRAELEAMLEAEPTVDVPELSAFAGEREDDRLEVARTELLELTADAATFDPTQEATLGRGQSQDENPGENPGENPDPPAQSIDEILSAQDIDDLTVAADGDTAAFAEAIAALEQSQFLDHSPAPAPDVRAQIEDTFGEILEDVAADTASADQNPDPNQNPDQNAQALEQAVNDAEPVDETASQVDSTLPVPKVRPRRSPDYIDANIQSNQARLVAHARIIFPDPDAAGDGAGDGGDSGDADPLQANATGTASQSGLGVTQNTSDSTSSTFNGVTTGTGTGTGTGIAGQGQGASPDATDLIAAQVRRAARDAANAAAAEAINKKIEIDWPVFAKSQFGWKVRGIVKLKDLEGNLLAMEAKIASAPSSASPAQIRAVEQAVLRGVGESFPWAFPQEYFEDWINSIEFIFCPQSSVFSDASKC